MRLDRESSVGLAGRGGARGGDLRAAEPPPKQRGDQCGAGGEEGEEAQLRAAAVAAAEVVLVPVELPLRLEEVVEGGLWREGFDHGVKAES